MNKYLNKLLCFGFSCLLILSFSSCKFRNQHLEIETPGENIYKIVYSYHEEGLFDGTVLVADSNGVVYKGAFGFANRNTEELLNTNSQFYLASVGKQFTSFAVLCLIENGNISLEDKIVNYVPELPEIYNDITIKNLLNHTSGIPDYYNFAKLFDGFSNSDVLNVLTSVNQLEFQPGVQYKYSNSGYVLLSVIVHRISGVSFSDYLTEKAFIKAGLTNTIVFDEDAGPIKNRAIGYSKNGNLTDYKFRTTGGGGIFSNVEDLFLWHLAITQGNIIDEQIINIAYQPTVLKNGKIAYYGAGWEIDKKDLNHVFHTGTLDGFRTYFDRQLNNRQVIILLSNNSSDFLEEMVNKIHESLSGKPENS